MKKASLSFLVLVFAALLTSVQSYAQINRNGGNIIQERVQMNLRMAERLRLADLLRLSYQEQRSLQIVSVTLVAQSLMQGSALIQLSELGRPLASEQVRRQMQSVRMLLPGRVNIENLELQAQSEMYLESIAVEVANLGPIPGPGPGPIPGPQYPQYEQQVSPNTLITLQVNQSVRGYASISLDQLARQQLGVTLSGAQIERVVVQGQPTMYGRQASVQVELNRRLVGQMKYLSTTQRQLPLPIDSFEEVRTLSLIVNGDAQISDIRVRVGSVRPQGPVQPQSQRIYVGQEVSPRYPLDLSRLLGYDQRLVRAITVEARSLMRLQGQLRILGTYGELQGSLMINSNSTRARIQLRRPMPISDIRLESLDGVMVDALELEVEAYRPY